MADILKVNETQTVNIIGTDLTGTPTFPAAVDSSGNQQVVVNNTVSVSRPSSYTTGTITTLNGAVTITVPEGSSAWDVYISGTFSAGSTVLFQGSLDNVNWFDLNGRRSGDATTNSITTTLSTTASGGPGPTGSNPSNWRGAMAAVRFFKVVSTAFFAGDNISIQIATAAATGAVFLNASIPTGNNTIGSVKVLDSAGIAIGSISDTKGINGLGVSSVATNFVAATGNNTITQLVSGATFTGTIETVYNQQALSVLLTSDQIGTLTLNQYIDAAGTRRTASFSYTVLPNQPFSRSFVANGNYFNLTFKNTGTASTTTLNIDVAYGTLPSSTNLGNTSVSLDESTGIPLGARPDGFFRTQIDPSTLIFDTFETLNTTDVWTTGGTTPPTAVAGSLTAAPGTAANASSYMASKPVFTPGSNAFLQYASLVQLEATVVTGNQRFFGLGLISSPTVTAPITNGVVFEIDSTTGALFGSVYSNSTRTNTLALIRPTDGLIHRYAMYYKASKLYFEIDNISVGTIAFPNPQISALSAVIGSINGVAIVASAPVLISSLIGVADTGRNSTQLSDGKFGWRKATIDTTGNLSVTGAVSSLSGSKITYSVSNRGLTSALTATDIFVISGSATKIVKIVKLTFSGTATNQVIVDLLMLKRSTVNAGGTIVALTPIPYDSTNPSATATVKAYTLNPTTLGTLVGQIRSDKIFLPSTAPTGSTGIGTNGIYEFKYGESFSQPITLRGINESLSLNLNSTTIAGSNFDINLEFTEE